MRRRGYRGVGSEYWQKVVRPYILNRDRWRCHYGGEPLVPERGRPNSATVDHVVRREHGGPDDYSNLVACCARHQFESARPSRVALTAEPPRFFSGDGLQDASLAPISLPTRPIRGEMTRK